MGADEMLFRALKPKLVLFALSLFVMVICASAMDPG
jgi:hypothetical protein